MPSGNTNILKAYIKKFNEIQGFYDNEFISDFDEYMNEGDIVSLECYYNSIKIEIKKNKKFVKELSLILKTNQQKNEGKYKEYIDNANKYLGDYKDQKSKIKSHIDNWNVR